MNINFTTTNQTLKRDDHSKLVARSSDYVRAAFSFTEDWNDVTKIAHFSNGADAAVDVELVENGCYIPAETLKGSTLRIWLEGIGKQGARVITTNVLVLWITRTGSTPGEPAVINFAESDTLDIVKDGNVLNIEIKKETLDKIDQETEDRATGDQKNAAALETEIKARTAADAELLEAIEAEASAREAADEGAASDLKKEADAREAADQNLAAQIKAETAQREAGDQLQAEALKEEKTARTDALNAEEQARTEADQAEAEARAQADQTEKKAREDADAAEAAERSRADAAEAQDREDADATEAAAREAGDQKNAENLAAEAAAREAADLRTEAQAHANAVMLADLKEQLYGYILDVADEEHPELDAAVLDGTVTVGDTVYNIADKARTAFTEVKGRTKKASNLLVFEDTNETTVKGMNYSIKNDVLEYSGTPTGKYKQIYADDIKPILTLGKTYFLKSWNTGNFYSQITIDYNDGTVTKRITEGLFTYSENVKTISFVIQNGVDTSETSGIIKPMLVEGSTAPTSFERGYDGLKSTTFEGVKITNKDKTKTTTLNFDKQTLNGVGTAQDSLVIVENESDSFYALKYIKRAGLYTFTGNEKWSLDSTGKLWGFTITKMTTVTNDTPNIISELPYAVVGLQTARNMDYAQTRYSWSYYVRNKDITTKEEMQQLTKGKVLYYPLATPIETILKTDLTIDQVSAIREAGGVIEVVGNEGEEFNVKPDITMAVIYKNTGGTPAAASLEAEEDV